MESIEQAKPQTSSPLVPIGSGHLVVGEPNGRPASRLGRPGHGLLLDELQLEDVAGVVSQKLQANPGTKTRRADSEARIADRPGHPPVMGQAGCHAEARRRSNDPAPAV